MAAVRALIARALLVAAGLVVGVALLEAALQAAAVYTAWARPHEQQQWLRGGQRAVCLGDSNTFGFFLERPAEQAYPRQIQQLWNARAPDAPIEVLNLGVPGMVSSKVRSTLPDIIRTLRPDVVFVMVGVNDFWIAPVPGVEEQASVTWVDALRNRSRVARLIYMIDRAWSQRSMSMTLPKVGEEKKPEAILHYGEHDIDLTPPELGGMRKRWREELEDNLIAVAEQARRANVRLILLTYPAEGSLYFQANAVIRSAAAASATTLVDLGKQFLPLCPSKDPQICTDLFFFDHHPRLRGHQLAATMIVEQLHGARNLAAGGGHEGER